MKIEPGRIMNDFIEPNKRQYIIPVYQRNYEWDREQCVKLFEDIVLAFRRDKSHFVGSVVYAPLKQVHGTKVTLFSKIPFELTAKEDRVRTCYMFACLAFVNSSAISHADIRPAFGLEENDKVKASRVIRDTMSAKLIKPVDPSTAPRYMRYVPFWA